MTWGVPVPKKTLTPEVAAVMARLRDEIESRGFTVHQVAIEMNIRPASFTDGTMSQHWIKLARRFGFSLDWVLLGNRDFERENQRLTAVNADQSAQLRKLGQAPPVQSAPELSTGLAQVDADLNRLDATGAKKSGRRKKPKTGTL